MIQALWDWFWNIIGLFVIFDAKCCLKKEKHSLVQLLLYQTCQIFDFKFLFLTFGLILLPVGWLGEYEKSAIFTYFAVSCSETPLVKKVYFQIPHLFRCVCIFKFTYIVFLMANLSYKNSDQVTFSAISCFGV